MFVVLALVATACSGDDDSDKAAASQPGSAEELFVSGFRLDSPSFQQKARPYVRIPPANSCYGDNLSPPLGWTEAPDGTESFALVAEDVDHHTGIWVHWVLYNIPAEVTGLPEGIPTTTDVLPDGTTQGTNDDRQPGYQGACPPPNIINYWAPGTTSREPPHKYEFTLYALDGEIGLAPRATKKELLKAMDGHILGEAKTVGKYTSPQLNKEKTEVRLTQTALAGAAD